MNSTLLINGKKQTKLSVLNRLVQFGDGLFETCLIVDARLLFWSKHFLRLEKGCDKLKIHPVSEAIWLQEISKALTISKLDQAVVKIILSRGQSVRGYGYEENIKPTRIVIVSPVPYLPWQYELGVCSSGYASNQLLSEIKHCNRLEQILARSELQAQECIMLDENAQVISVTQGNIFAICNRVIFTPSLTDCGIEGTRRSVVFDLAQALGLQLETCSLSLTELLEADEVFITNSVMGISPVAKINHKLFNHHQITNQLINAFVRSKNNHSSSVSLKSKPSYWKFIFIFATIFLLFWMYWANGIKANNSNVYQIPQGASLYSTANNLEHLGYINSSFFMRLLAKSLNLESKIKSGYYDINANMSMINLLNNFTSAKVATRSITLIEGNTIDDYYQKLTNMKALKSSKTLAEIMIEIKQDHPYDGYFWPDTYQINYGDSVLSVFKRAHQIMRQKLELAWRNKAHNFFLKNVEQALVLASLIEKETANAQEKPKIAGVFIRRLQKSMRLQTDPSVVYALGKRYQAPLKKRDLKFNSPYNTYRNKGLPPGPISSVGVDSLYAATHPHMSDALYFLAKKDGTHAFANTYQQHKNNINKYLKNQ